VDRSLRLFRCQDIAVCFVAVVHRYQHPQDLPRRRPRDAQPGLRRGSANSCQSGGQCVTRRGHGPRTHGSQHRVRTNLGGHEVGLIRSDLKRLIHPELGVLELHCQMLFDFDQSQALLVFTATPGSESYEKLQLLSVIGEQRLNP
jgi:hypothetical protein